MIVLCVKIVIPQIECGDTLSIRIRFLLNAHAWKPSLGFHGSYIIIFFQSWKRQTKTHIPNTRILISTQLQPKYPIGSRHWYDWPLSYEYHNGTVLKFWASQGSHLPSDVLFPKKKFTINQGVHQKIQSSELRLVKTRKKSHDRIRRYWRFYF